MLNCEKKNTNTYKLNKETINKTISNKIIIMGMVCFKDILFKIIKRQKNHSYIDDWVIVESIMNNATEDLREIRNVKKLILATRLSLNVT